MRGAGFWIPIIHSTVLVTAFLRNSLSHIVTRYGKVVNQRVQLYNTGALSHDSES